MKQLLVIGAGVVGLCCAYYARQAGFAVTVLERHQASYEGTSFGNAGMIVPSHFVPLSAPGIVAQGLRWMLNPESPFYIKPRLDPDLLKWAYLFWRSATQNHVDSKSPLLLELNLASKGLYQDLATVLKPFGLEQKGLVMLCSSDQGLEKEVRLAKLAKHLGLSTQVLDKSAVKNYEPNLDMNIVGGVYYADDAHMNPKALMLALRAWLEQAGVQFLWSTEVRGWRKEAKTLRAVLTSRGEFPLGKLVMTAGIWSSKLLKELKLDLPMQAGKGYSMVLDEPPQPFHTPAILSEAKVAISPLGKSVRFGGTMEISGLEERINPHRVQGIIKSVLRYFPAYKEADFSQKAIWYGFRPCSPDGLPYLGQLAYDNLLVATGHAMMGLSLAPITGKLITELLSGQRPSVTLKALHPDRF